MLFHAAKIRIFSCLVKCFFQLMLKMVVTPYIGRREIIEESPKKLLVYKLKIIRLSY